MIRGRADGHARLRLVFTLFGVASLAYGVSAGIGVLLGYHLTIKNAMAGYLPSLCAEATGWILAGTMSFLILHRLVDGLRLTQRRSGHEPAEDHFGSIHP